MIPLILAVAAAEAAAGDTPSWLVPFGGAGAGAFAIMAAGFMTNRLYTGLDFRRELAAREASETRERATQDYLRAEIVPLLVGSKDAILAATRLVEKMADREDRHP